MSEIDRIVERLIDSLLFQSDGDEIKALIRAALLEYGQIVREEERKEYLRAYKMATPDGPDGYRYNRPIER